MRFDLMEIEDVYDRCFDEECDEKESAIAADEGFCNCGKADCEDCGDGLPIVLE